MSTQDDNAYKWPSAHRNARDFTTRVRHWFKDHDLFFRLHQSLREDLLASARDVYEGFSTHEKTDPEVDDAETSLQTLELQFGEGSFEPQDRRQGLSDRQLVAIAVNPWMEINEDQVGEQRKDSPLHSHRRELFDRGKVSEAQHGTGQRSRKRRRVIVDEDSDDSFTDVQKTSDDHMPEVVESSPEGWPEPDPRPIKRRRLSDLRR